MHKWLALLILLFVVIAVAVPVVTSKAPDESGTRRILTVRNLHDAPEHHSGDIQVLGVVAAVDEEHSTFGIMDAAEAEACGTDVCADCSTAIIPVAWEGGMPETGNKVLVSGRIAPSPRGLVLSAAQVVVQ